MNSSPPHAAKKIQKIMKELFNFYETKSIR